jgi:diguanylate cyclase (GGDEF)-like protein
MQPLLSPLVWLPLLLATAAVMLAGWLAGRLRRERQEARKQATLADAYISHMAKHDALTGLPNRSELHERCEVLLAEARRRGSGVALLLLDLDHFKHINETLGHPVGDDLLRTIADRIRGAVRPDVVARMGGDEFAVALGDLRFDGEAELVAAKILARVSEDLPLAGEHVRVTPSLGMAIFPQDGNSLTDLMKSADAAMYAAKHGGRAQLAFCQRDGGGIADALHDRGVAPSRAGQGEFRLRYQPIVDVSRLALLGVEALIAGDPRARRDAAV